MPVERIVKSEEPFQFPEIDLVTTPTITDYILQHFQKSVEAHEIHGDLPCIGNSLTGEFIPYSGVEVGVNRIGNFLWGKGLRRGGRVLFSSHDGTRLHLFLLAVWKIGGVARASYPEDLGDDLVSRLIEFQPQIIFCDEHHLPENLEAVKKAKPLLKDKNIAIIVGVSTTLPSKDFEDPWVHSLFKIMNAELVGNENTFSNTNSLWEDVAYIGQTSGTSGPSKGAIFTQKAVLGNLLAFQALPCFEPQSLLNIDLTSPFLCSSRLTHQTGTFLPLSLLCLGQRVLLNPSPSSSNISTCCRKYGVKGLLAFPKFLLEISQEYKDIKLNYAVIAGQVVGPDFFRKVGDGLTSNIFNIYGMTEAGIITVNGKLSGGSEAKITSLEKDENENNLSIMGVGEIGEVWVKTVYQASGYFGMETVSSNTFTNDGWVRTGDVGCFDDMNNLILKGRVKETFKYFNNHIWPSELEEILVTHPLVMEALIQGVPDPEGGDTIPRAFVVLAHKSALKVKEEETLDEIKTFFEAKVPSYKKLRGGIFALEKLPVGKTGKVCRNSLPDANFNTM